MLPSMAQDQDFSYMIILTTSSFVFHSDVRLWLLTEMIITLQQCLLWIGQRT
jgi:hypothetical protein